ncbi:MAG: glycoside hydrolase family 38 [Lentisphaerae bacterium]|nr:glycoside hydrolase family 38 [Lentisphaerota bacterium]
MKQPQPLTLHLIANAHLDPVWLWDWREGLNEGISTCRAVLNLMDEYPDLTFIRGEAAVYAHIAEHDPETFHRIAAQVRAGRWELVGGTWIQPDTNMPATETFVRHFLRGQRYFESAFGKRVRVAWAADSFGHSAGLPDLMAATGIDSFACTRPMPGQLSLPSPVFWWEGAGGGRVLVYRPSLGWYGVERDEIPKRFDALLAAGRESGLHNIGALYGLGNHGGGPTRRLLQDIRAWADANPEVRVVHSGLSRLFTALRAERPDWPTHRGELNYCLRGCYSSAARFKFAYRKAEAAVARAERTDTAVSAALARPPADLREPWEAVLFNSFHDILPGTSIERAFTDQLAWIGGAQFAAQRAELGALNALALRVDTRVPTVKGDHPTAVPFLVWNPHPHAVTGLVELEASLDQRPLFGYHDRVDQVPVEVRGPTGHPQPFQTIATEHLFFPRDAWRKRVVTPVSLPPLGWCVLSLGWVLGAKPQTGRPIAIPLRTAKHQLTFWNRVRLSVVTVEDKGGSWGGMDESPAACNLQTVLQRWTVSESKLIEQGPLRSVLWARLTGGQSHLDLHITQDRGRQAVDVAARVFWNERGARLKLVLSDFGDTAVFDVPGGTARRGPVGEVPGGRWVKGRYFFASDALYNFNLHAGSLQATVCRSAHFADSGDGAGRPWHPVMDQGELSFRFLLSRRADERLARLLEEPVIAQTVPASKGNLARSGSLLALAPATVKLLALKPAEDGRGIILRVQDTSGHASKPRLKWMGHPVTLGLLRAGEIATWRLLGRRAHRVSSNELDRPRLKRH